MENKTEQIIKQTKNYAIQNEQHLFLPSSILLRNQNQVNKRHGWITVEIVRRDWVKTGKDRI